MSFDVLVANAGRLRILAALAGGEGRDVEFVELRQETRLTDGNLASHARRLEGAGFISIRKAIRDNKPVTTYRLTTDGRAALELHLRTLMQAILPRDERSLRGVQTPAPAPAPPFADQPDHDDEWVD